MSELDRAPARRLDPGEILTGECEPVAYRVDRFAADACVTILAAYGGEGKSIVANALASATPTRPLHDAGVWLICPGPTGTDRSGRSSAPRSRDRS